MSTELTNEELYDLLKKADDNKLKRPKKEYGVNKSVKAFAEKLGIQSGDIKVPTYKIFYEYYVKWTSRNRADKIGRHAFFREFNKIFQSYRNGRQRYYWLNDCFDMSEEEMKKAYRHRTVKKSNYTK